MLWTEYVEPLAGPSSSHAVISTHEETFAENIDGGLSANLINQMLLTLKQKKYKSIRPLCVFDH